MLMLKRVVRALRRLNIFGSFCWKIHVHSYPVSDVHNNDWSSAEAVFPARRGRINS